MTSRIASKYDVPSFLINRIVDRLGLGTRLNGHRVIFAEEIPTIEFALKLLGKLRKPVQPDSVTEVMS
jgi:hypothetical protein